MKKSFYKITHKNIVFKDLRDKITEYFFTPKGARIYKVPKFRNLKDEDILNYSLIKPDWTYRNNIYWTPRFYVQKDLSREFLSELKKFRKLEEWTELDYLALTQLIVTEAIRDTTYAINYNKEIKPSYNNPFHGNIEMLLFNTEEDSKNLPMIPIIFPNYERSRAKLLNYEIYNINQMIGMSLAILNISSVIDPTIDHVRSFFTNGHEWALYEVHKDFVKRTNFFRPNYRGRDKYYTPKFYDDYDHIRAILGLIRYALYIEDNMVLKSSIYKLDEKSEYKLIQNKEAINNSRDDFPDVIENIGLNKNLLDYNKKDEQKFLK